MFGATWACDPRQLSGSIIFESIINYLLFPVTWRTMLLLQQYLIYGKGVFFTINKIVTSYSSYGPSASSLNLYNIYWYYQKCIRVRKLVNNVTDKSYDLDAWAGTRAVGRILEAKRRWVKRWVCPMKPWWHLWSCLCSGPHWGFHCLLRSFASSRFDAAYKGWW